MLHQDDLKWIAKTSAELNTVLQQIARYADLARRHKGDHDYIEQLNQQVEIASQSAQALFNRVSSKILENTSGKTLPPSETDAPAPVAEGDTPDVIGPRTSMATQIAILNPEGERELILIIDDEPEIAEFASTILAEEGYKVIVARDGFEALKIFQQIHDQIGLIILDFFLPVMDGDAVFEELKAINPSVNVVLSSGFAEQNKIGAMLAKGLRGFMPKPYTREKLLEQVKSTIEASQRPIR
jgi:CheY-like chemotaxis protein